MRSLPSNVPTDRRLLLRFVIGAAYVGRARLLAELRAYESDGARSPEPVQLRHRLLGALILIPEAVWAAASEAGAHYRRAADRLMAPVVRRLRASRAGERIAGERQRLQLAVERVTTRWGVIGEAEEAAARALASATFRRVYDEVFDRMTRSAKLQHLIEEHSAGLTRGVVAELRDLSAEADARVERFAHRLWRRNR